MTAPAAEAGLAMLRTMLRIRAFEEAAARAYAEGLVTGSLHEYTGQEAIATGVCRNLRRDDWVTSYHRGHGHAIAKGADIGALMKELFGREGGCCGGKGGSMHVADVSFGLLGANGVVGDGATLALGAAHAARTLQPGRIAVCFHGDGALNRGPLLEALNWAALYSLPLLFVCEDNQYSATVRSSATTAGPGAVARAQAFGLHAAAVDGNDVFGVDECARALVARVRETGTPAFLHARTYRLRGHLVNDPAAYRTKDEVEVHERGEPIARCEQRLLAAGVPPHELSALRQAVARELQAAVDQARAAAWPAPERAFRDVQDVGDGRWFG